MDDEEKEESKTKKAESKLPDDVKVESFDPQKVIASRYWKKA
jgi:hypothetical protein